MKRKRILRSGEKSALTSLAGAIGITLITLLLSSLAASVILMYTEYPMGSVPAAALAVLLIGGAFSGFINTRAGGECGMRNSLSASLIVGAVIFILKIAFGGWGCTLHAFMDLGCFLGINAIFALLSRSKAKRRVRRHH